MYKYILLWCCPDDNFQLFNDYSHLLEYLKVLKENYKGDSSFSYKVFKGRDITGRI